MPAWNYFHPRVGALPRRLILELGWRMANHRSVLASQMPLPASGAKHHTARWFCVDLNQNTEDGIELVYIQSETFYGLAEMLGITKHGLKHRAFEVPAEEVNPRYDQTYDADSLGDETTLRELKSRFKYQHRNLRHA